MDQQELVLRGVLSCDYDAALVRLQIQGNDITANSHQEIRACLENRRCVRISRTNGMDEVEASDLSCMEQLDHVLDELDFQPPKMTFRDLYSIFEKARQTMPRYDQGNCVALSRMIVHQVDSDRYAEEVNEANIFGF